MENKLRYKFQLIAMTCVVLVMIMIVAPINTVVMHKMEKSIDVKLKLISDNNGVFPAFGIQYDTGFVDFGILESYIYGSNVDDSDENYKFASGTNRPISYYSVKTDLRGNAFDVNIFHIDGMDSSKAVENALHAISLESEKGYQGAYKYLIEEKDYGKIVVFIDCFAEQNIKVMLLLVSFSVAFFVCCAVMVLMRFFSVIFIRPFVENMNNQRRFITDASHELKTPLAIISANAEVLEMTNGENEWIDSIKHQTVRMNDLIKQLVFLCKYSERGEPAEFVDFCISDVLAESTEVFDVVAKSQGKSISMKIAPDIKYKGDEASIRQLFSILLDNAVKYASEKSEIRVKLSKQGKGVKIAVENDCNDIDEKSLAHVFERFYRADSSRARETGGFGIGLSIANAIVQAHKGRINAKSIDGKAVSFIITL